MLYINRLVRVPSQERGPWDLLGIPAGRGRCSAWPALIGGRRILFCWWVRVQKARPCNADCRGRARSGTGV